MKGGAVGSNRDDAERRPAGRADRDGGLLDGSEVLGKGVSRRDFLRGSMAATAALGLRGLDARGRDSFSSRLAGSSISARSAGSPKRGGRLSVALVGGGISETVNPNSASADADYARLQALYDQLTTLKPDRTIGMALAESFEANSDGTHWTVKLRPGVTFHDGSAFTANDVISTLRYIMDPKNTSILKPYAGFIDTKALSTDGPLTVQMPMTKPVGDLPSLFATGGFVMWKAGTTDFSKPNGTGAFSFKEFTPGTSSLFLRNPHYWNDGLPYVDELAILSIPDTTSRLDALLDGSVDAIPTLTFPQVEQYQHTKKIQLLVANHSTYSVPIYMDVKRPPFTDVRVRQAMRLIVDRPQMIEVAQLGFGEVANDLYGKGLPYYDSQLPQRHQDLDRAKSLLKQAGQEDLSITLYTSTLAPGMEESAELFSEQAVGAGVKVHVDNVPASSFYTSVYLKVPFSQDYWYGSPIPIWMLVTVVTGAAFPETDFGTPHFDSMVNAAFAEVDQKRAATLWDDVQSVLYDTGGYIFWGTRPFIDGLSLRVRGAVPSAWSELSDFHFEEWWLD